MANELFGKQAMDELKQANREKKEKNKIVIGDQNVRLIPANPLFKFLGAGTSSLSILCFIFWFLGSGAYRLLSRTSVIPILEGMKKILSPFSSMSFLIGIVSLCIFLIVYLIGLRPPAFDRWVRDIAKKRLSCEYIFFNRRGIFIQYDVNLEPKDIKDFIQALNNRSERFTYYLDNIDVDSYTVSINIAKRQVIPKKCTIDTKKDTTWNFCPMGLAVNDDLKKITDIGWYMNDNNSSDEAIETLPSTSMLIAGGTGSGKSVVENGIIGHITRHPNHIQAFLCDVKMVEFNNLDKYQGVHKVALTIEEVAEIIDQIQKLMMSRFQFMKEMGVNNIYKLKGQEVNWYQIGNKKYQFDEVMQCKIDGKPMLLTIEDIFKYINNGSDVEIDDKCLVD